MAPFLDQIGDALSWLKKPASAAAGGYVGMSKLLAKELDPNKKYDFGNPLEGIWKGWNRDYNAAQAIKDLAGNTEKDSGLTQALGIATNIGGDPLTYVGALGKVGALGSLASKSPRVAQAIEGAGKIGGTIEKGVPGAARLGQAGRRYGVGLAATGDPLTALGVAGMQAPVEWGLKAASKSKAVQNLLTKGIKAPVSKVAGVADEAVSGATPTAKAVTSSKRERIFGTPKNKRTTPDLADEAIPEPTPTSPVAQAGENLGRGVRVEGGGPVYDSDTMALMGGRTGQRTTQESIQRLAQATATPTVASVAPEEAGVAKLQALLGKSGPPKPTVPARTPTPVPEELIGGPAAPAVRGPLIGAEAPPPELIQSVAQQHAARGLGQPQPSMAAMTPPTQPTMPAQPMTPPATQMQMPMPTSGPVQTNVPGGVVPPMPPQNPAIPPFLKQAPKPFEGITGGAQPKLGQGNPDLENLMSNPAIAEILNDPTLTADKQLEMILRGLGAIT